MVTASFLKGLSDSVASGMEASRARAVEVAAGCGDPTEALARLVLSWPPRDVRLDERYVASHDVKDTSDMWVKDVVSGVRVREERREPGAGVLVVSLDFHSNMAEFERYNSVVQTHNRAWIAAGLPKDAIDPWTGGISEVEGYVDYARAADDLPRMGEGGGPLDSARPVPVRSSHVTVEYRASERDGVWTLGFVARDRRGIALCWDESSGGDLAALVRRSVQILYGNHEVVGNVGPLSDGLRMLVQGRKAAVCRERCSMPGWAAGPVRTGVSEEYVEARVGEVGCGFLAGVFGGFSSLVCIVGMLVWALFCLVQNFGQDDPGRFAGVGWFVGGELALGALLWVSAYVSIRLRRASEAARMRSMYL